MTMREIDNGVLKNVDAKNIFTEIHRLEGRMDFLYFCEGIPKEIKEKELEEAHNQMNMLQAKMLMYIMKGEV